MCARKIPASVSNVGRVSPAHLIRRRYASSSKLIGSSLADGPRRDLPERLLQLVQRRLARAQLLEGELGERDVGGAGEVVHVAAGRVDEEQAGGDLAGGAVAFQLVGGVLAVGGVLVGGSLRKRTTLPSCMVTAVTVPGAYSAVISVAGGTKSAAMHRQQLCLRVLA